MAEQFLARMYLCITPIKAIMCQQCLSLSVVQLKGKHCQKPYCHNGVVATFGHGGGRGSLMIL